MNELENPLRIKHIFYSIRIFSITLHFSCSVYRVHSYLSPHAFCRIADKCKFWLNAPFSYCMLNYATRPSIQTMDFSLYWKPFNTLINRVSNDRNWPHTTVVIERATMTIFAYHRIQSLKCERTVSARLCSSLRPHCWRIIHCLENGIRFTTDSHLPTT